ncbi:MULTISPECIES: hypothetical protein [Burkholderia]|uniref:hypothetical protein n=1 Tax=Burkholderia TaxID=32008 RepID=UPI000ABD6564|nr:MULTISPECIES: hypothetical protein [Burkholderia]
MSTLGHNAFSVSHATALSTIDAEIGATATAIGGRLRRCVPHCASARRAFARVVRRLIISGASHKSRAQAVEVRSCAQTGEPYRFHTTVDKCALEYRFRI